MVVSLWLSAPVMVKIAEFMVLMNVTVTCSAEMSVPTGNESALYINPLS